MCSLTTHSEIWSFLELLTHATDSDKQTAKSIISLVSWAVPENMADSIKLIHEVKRPIHEVDILSSLYLSDKTYLKGFDKKHAMSIIATSAPKKPSDMRVLSKRELKPVNRSTDVLILFKEAFMFSFPSPVPNTP